MIKGDEIVSLPMGYGDANSSQTSRVDTSTQCKKVPCLMFWSLALGVLASCAHVSSGQVQT